MSVRPSVRPCGVNSFKTPRLQDRWADVDETWHVLYVSGDKTSRERNFEFRPLRRAGEMTPKCGVLYTI